MAFASRPATLGGRGGAPENSKAPLSERGGARPFKKPCFLAYSSFRFLVIFLDRMAGKSGQQTCPAVRDGAARAWGTAMSTDHGNEVFQMQPCS
jgi:hypothetical protein